MHMPTMPAGLAYVGRRQRRREEESEEVEKEVEG